MKCSSKVQAERVANAGAAKMIGEYVFKAFPMSQVAGHVVKADGTRYTVNTHTSTCNCAFYGENRAFQTCKHLVFAKAEIAWEAARIEEYELSGR